LTPSARQGAGAALLVAALLAGCDRSTGDRGNAGNKATARTDFARNPDGFPLPARPVATLAGDRTGTETSRDRRNEARAVMDRAGIKPGMTVADIGAGEGYYTIRLAARVGAKGRVLAEEINADLRDGLAERVNRERLDNVSVRLGDPADPRLPPNSFDRVMMVHMYHEIQQPYEFLWNVRPALKPDGQLIVVDADRPTDRHGMPPRLLDCEMAALGLEPVRRITVKSAGGYFASYRAKGRRPLPQAIRPCNADGRPL
jgi:ubiquinone/menaquinone biosynthesis C-methylase UbiE